MCVCCVYVCDPEHKLVCPECQKQFALRSRSWYDKHVRSCHRDDHPMPMVVAATVAGASAVQLESIEEGDEAGEENEDKDALDIDE